MLHYFGLIGYNVVNVRGGMSSHLYRFFGIILPQLIPICVMKGATGFRRYYGPCRSKLFN